MNAVMEQQLQAYVNYLQDDWTDYLFLAEFARNNQVSDSTILSPFFANLGFHPGCDFQLDIRVDNPEKHQAQTTAERLHQIHKVARSEMQYPHTQQQYNTDV